MARIRPLFHANRTHIVDADFLPRREYLSKGIRVDDAAPAIELRQIAGLKKLGGEWLAGTA